MPAPSVQSSTASGTLASGFKSIVASMMMEAAEKCEEIDVKCDEEYQVLRRKEISEQGEIIETTYKKRREVVLRDDRVCYTKLINNFRLAQLKAKNDIVNDILKTVKQRISTDSSSKYQHLLENSLTQAMYMLMEPEVYISCRKKDQSIISSTFPSAARIYERNTKLRVSIGFSKSNLPENSSAGGMLVSNKKETITVNCSLDSRVEQVCYLAMPMIVEMLFADVPMAKDSPKLSLQKALSPSPQDPTSRLEQKRSTSKLDKKSEHSMSPPLGLQQERLGIGTSTINILGPGKPSTGEHNSDDDQQSNHTEGEYDQDGATGRRSVAKSAASDKNRNSTTRNLPPQDPESQGPSSENRDAGYR